MSGTSMDGVDAVLLETDGMGYAKHLCGITIDYHRSFKVNLRIAEAEVRLNHGNQATRPELLEAVIKESTAYHIKACEELIKKANSKNAEIAVIGYHGQSLYHNPKLGVSVQVGDGDKMAKCLGIPVVTDFRIADIQNDGQGAPLAPLYHQVLAIQSKLLPVVVINCGGIANASVILGEEPGDVVGFDTGPGNVLVDRYIREKTNGTEFMDKDGQYGRNGSVDMAVFTFLKEHLSSYMAKLPPKSLDPSEFVLPEIINSLAFEDACATLEAFTAYSIVESIKTHTTKQINNWVLAGGGWKNPVILDELRKLAASEIAIVKAEAIGWSSVFMEAGIFAYLATRCLLKLPITYPSITGCKTPTLGGRITS